MRFPRQLDERNVGVAVIPANTSPEGVYEFVSFCYLTSPIRAASSAASAREETSSLR